jgi:hypothetical protein
MNKVRYIVLFVMACLLFLSMPQSVQVVDAAGDWVRIDCRKIGNEYKMTCKYKASVDRLILIAVVKKSGGSTRISRRRVKPGTSFYEWSAKESKFGRLTKACAAMHRVDNNRETISSDCDVF